MFKTVRRVETQLAKMRKYSYLDDYLCFKNKVKSFNNDGLNLEVKDLDIWKSKMISVAKRGKTFLDIADNFFSTYISCIKSSEDNVRDIILICVIKNDLGRLKAFLDYYRSIGIKHFAFLDDSSSDGTKEYLLEQKDVDLFISKESYSTNRRQAWINRLVAYYGVDRWFLVADSDEFLSIKQKTVQDLIALGGAKLTYRCLLVDMYPLDNHYSEDFINDYRGFDTDTYDVDRAMIWCNGVTGGMRKRVFSTKEVTLKPYLFKTPIFKSSRNFIQLNSHFNYPFSYQDDFIGIIRHYKFLKSDFEKYQERIKKQNFVTGSQEYKLYDTKFNDTLSIDFTYASSAKFETYDSFYKINVYKKNKYN